MKKIILSALICLMCAVFATGCGSSTDSDLARENEELRQQLSELQGNQDSEETSDDAAMEDANTETATAATSSITEATGSDDTAGLAPFEVISMEQGATEYGFMSTYYTLKNNTDQVITNVTLTISDMDANGTIISTSYGSASVNVDPGQSIRVKALHEENPEIKSVKLDGYGYYIYDATSQTGMGEYKSGKFQNLTLAIN